MYGSMNVWQYGSMAVCMYGSMYGGIERTYRKQTMGFLAHMVHLTEWITGEEGGRERSGGERRERERRERERRKEER